MFEHNHIPDLVQEILRGKALATIVESATVTDASGNAVDLKNLRPDGSIGEPEAERPRPTPRSTLDDAEPAGRGRGRADAGRPRTVHSQPAEQWVRRAAGRRRRTRPAGHAGHRR